MTGQASAAAKALKVHPPAGIEARRASAAAVPPADHEAAQAEAHHTDEMAAAKPKGFDKAAFIAAVRKAVADAAPQNLDEADKFGKSGKAAQIKGQVLSTVTRGKEESGKAVEETTERTPDRSPVRPKQVTPLKPSRKPRPTPPKGGTAMPPKAPESQTTLDAGSCDVDAQMREEGVTDEMLENSNESDMQGALEAKKEAKAHAAEAPATVRTKEAEVLQGARQDAASRTSSGMEEMSSTRDQKVATTTRKKEGAKSKDEAERLKITAAIRKIFDATKKDVTTILDGLDDKVARTFDAGEANARAAFRAKHKAGLEAYKDRRYSGLDGKALWVRDLFADLPDEANQVYVAARKLYETRMEKVISDVADLVGRELQRAKARIAAGRAEVKSYVAKQPKRLQGVASEAAQEIGKEFQQLVADVESKQQSMVDDLAQRYVAARNEVDAEIKAEQEKNKGLVSKAKDAVEGAIDTIKKLKDLFLGVLSRAASALNDVLKAPVEFIGNFMGALKQGFSAFAGNILQHLKKGLMGWLFGTLASAGIQLPESFDAKGILGLIASLLGLTWANIKARLMRRIPAPVVEFLESKSEVFMILATEGIGGLWKFVMGKLSDLKERILGPIKEFVVEKVVKAGITWILGMLNPAGALVKAVQALVSIVQWVMSRGAQLAEFVGTVVDAVKDIAKGGGGGVPGKIESALSNALPLAISFLASLLGLGGISDKIKSIIQAVQRPVQRAIDAVINGALKLARPLINKLKGLGAKAKAKLMGGDDSPKGKKQRLRKGMKTGVAAANRFAGKRVGRRVLTPLLSAIRIRYGLSILRPVPGPSTWRVEGTVARAIDDTDARVKTSDKGDGNEDERSDLKWDNPKSVKTFGHTFTTHGQKQSRSQLADRARSKGHQISKWNSDARAAPVIARIASAGPGEHNEPIDSSLGTSVLPNGEEVPVDMARVIVRENGSVRTAFPYSSAHPNR